MEALGLGIPVATSAKDQPFPVLVSDSNFEELAWSNFSGRCRLSEAASIPADQIIKVLGSTDARRHLSENALSWFEKWYSAETGARKLCGYYGRILDSREKRSWRSRSRELYHFNYISRELYHFEKYFRKQKA
jgi:glycosyltransferase involved in cell wall biosynthesis